MARRRKLSRKLNAAVGAGSLVDLNGKATHRAARDEHKAARMRSKSDWHAVGQDFTKVMKHVSENDD